MNFFRKDRSIKCSPSKSTIKPPRIDLSILILIKNFLPKGFKKKKKIKIDQKMRLINENRLNNLLQNLPKWFAILFSSPHLTQTKQ